MVFGQQQFDNNVQTTMTNNNGGTAFSTWRWLFTSNATTARTISGDGLAFFDFGGQDPQIINRSSATHALNVAVSGDGSSGDPFQIWLDSTGGLTFGSTVNNQGGNIEIQGTASGAKTVTFGGIVSGSGGMYLNNANATALFDAANTFSGQLTINAGTARLNNSDDTFGASTQAIRIGTGATLDLNGVSTTVGSVAEEGSSDSGSINLGAGTLTVTANDLNLLQGNISGTGGLTKQGSHTLNLFGTQGYTGTTTVSGGTLSTGVALASSAVTVSGGTFQTTAANILGDTAAVTVDSGTYALGGNDTIGALSGTGGAVNLGANLLTTTISSGSSSYAGAISGSGGLTKTGAGTLTLSGSNTFGGVLTVADGKLTVSTVNNASQNGVLGNSTNAVVLGADGQTGFLHYVGNTNASTDKAFTAATGGTAGIEASNAATTLTLSGAIGGAGNVQKGGAGTIILAGANTFSGALNIHDGTVQVGALSGLGNATSIGIGKSGTENVSTLRYTGNSATTTKNISMNSSNNVSGIINVATSGATLTVEGQISGTSGLTKTGLGRLSLSASSSYNGPTTVSAGDLNLSGGSIANSSVNVLSGASLSGYGSVGTIGGAGTINPGNSPGIVTAPQVNPSAGTDFNFEFTGLAPTFNNAASSVNDLIRITTSGTPFSQSLDPNNIINVYFSGAALFTGSTAVQYKGGFFTDRSTSFAGSITNATFNYFFANDAGTNTYNGVNFYTRSQYETLVLNTNMLISISTVAQTANFGSGNVNGEIMQFEVIPEPSTYALLALSALGLGAYQWRRRRRG
jgi:fibronectin-binding autotransporter adhesin